MKVFDWWHVLLKTMTRGKVLKCVTGTLVVKCRRPFKPSIKFCRPIKPNVIFRTDDVIENPVEHTGSAGTLYVVEN